MPGSGTDESFPSSHPSSRSLTNLRFPSGPVMGMLLCGRRNIISATRSLITSATDLRGERFFLGTTPFSAATLPLSTLAQSPLPTPLQSTHAHLSHFRPPIAPAVPTHANLVSPNSFPCNTCEKKHHAVGAPTFLECGGSPSLLRLTEWRPINRLAEVDYVAKAGASSRTPKGIPALRLRGTRFPSMLNWPLL